MDSFEILAMAAWLAGSIYDDEDDDNNNNSNSNMFPADELFNRTY